MRFAAIADIHGNCLALEAVLADIAAMGIEDVVNLGDHLSGPLEARRTADLLIEHGFPSIRGNHDRYLIDQDPAEMPRSDKAAFDQLEPKHLDWLATLPPTMVWRERVFLCHGTPASDLTYWMERITADGGTELASLEDIERAASDVAYPLILCAHTHIPRIVRLQDGRLIVNPGSVGCPAYDDDQPMPHKVQTGTPHACYAILQETSLGWSASHHYVPYDHTAMVALAEKMGRLEWASALATGWLR